MTSINNTDNLKYRLSSLHQLHIKPEIQFQQYIKENLQYDLDANQGAGHGMNLKPGNNEVS